MRNRESLIRLHKFQVDEKRRKVAELELMLAEFRQRERDLEAQVEQEQRKAGISDVAHFAYPMFAKSVIRRRENILESIEGIARQLESAKDELSGAFRGDACRAGRTRRDSIDRSPSPLTFERTSFRSAECALE